MLAVPDEYPIQPSCFSFQVRHELDGKDVYGSLRV